MLDALAFQCHAFPPTSLWQFPCPPIALTWVLSDRDANTRSLGRNGTNKQHHHRASAPVLPAAAVAVAGFAVAGFAGEAFAGDDVVSGCKGGARSIGLSDGTPEPAPDGVPGLDVVVVPATSRRADVTCAPPENGQSHTRASHRDDCECEGPDAFTTNLTPTTNMAP